MNERGKLSFKTSKNIENNKELSKLKKHWESFAETEETDREKYLRELEIQFSMDSFVKGDDTKATNKVTDFIAEKKVEEQDFSEREKFDL